MENKIEKYTYTRSLCMVLYRAVTLEAPGMTLRVEHSISHGQYCRLLQADGSVVQVNRDLAGRSVSRPQAGIYIKTTTYRDGKRKSVKTIIK